MLIAPAVRSRRKEHKLPEPRVQEVAVTVAVRRGLREVDKVPRTNVHEQGAEHDDHNRGSPDAHSHVEARIVQPQLDFHSPKRTC